MKIVLTTGTIVDTEDPNAEEDFAASEPEIAAGLMKAAHCLHFPADRNSS
jgi:hypothetical protein